MRARDDLTGTRFICLIASKMAVDVGQINVCNCFNQLKMADKHQFISEREIRMGSLDVSRGLDQKSLTARLL